MNQEHQGGTNLPGLAQACKALAGGQVVAVPNPPPMTYGLLALTAQKINAVKARPLDQNVAVSVHNPAEWQRLVACLDLPAGAADGVVTLLRLRLTALLPLRAGVPQPHWIAPAVRGHQLCAFNGYWAATAAIWRRFPRLYGSSANRSGQPPATSVATAQTVIGPNGVVVDGDGMTLGGTNPDTPARSAASTMIAVDPQGRLELHRSGAHDQVWADGPEAYLTRLSALTGPFVPRQKCS